MANSELDLVGARGADLRVGRAGLGRGDPARVPALDAGAIDARGRARSTRALARERPALRDRRGRGRLPVPHPTRVRRGDPRRDSPSASVRLSRACARDARAGRVPPAAVARRDRRPARRRLRRGAEEPARARPRAHRRTARRAGPARAVRHHARPSSRRSGCARSPICPPLREVESRSSPRRPRRATPSERARAARGADARRAADDPTRSSRGAGASPTTASSSFTSAQLARGQVRAPLGRSRATAKLLSDFQHLSHEISSTIAT